MAARSCCVRFPIYGAGRGAITPVVFAWLLAVIGVAFIFSMCSSALAQGASPAPTPIISKDIIWFETPVAEISVGFDAAQRRTRQRTFYLAYVGPKAALASPVGDPTFAMRTARSCTEKTVRPIRDQLQHQLALADAKFDDDTPS